MYRWGIIGLVMLLIGVVILLAVRHQPQSSKEQAELRELERTHLGVGLPDATAVQFGADGRTLVSVHQGEVGHPVHAEGEEPEDRTIVCIWNLQSSHKPRRQWEMRQALAGSAISSDAKLLAAQLAPRPNLPEQALHVWEVESGKVVCKIALTRGAGEKESGIWSSPAFWPDGKVAVSRSVWGQVPQIQIWDVQTGKLTRLLNIEGRLNDWALLGVARDGKSFLLKDDHDSFEIRRTTDGSLLAAFSEADLVPQFRDFSIGSFAAALAPDGNRIAFGCTVGGTLIVNGAIGGQSSASALVVYDVLQRKKTAIPIDIGRGPCSLAFDPAGKQLAIGLFSRSPTDVGIGQTLIETERKLIVLEESHTIRLQAVTE